MATAQLIAGRSQADVPGPGSPVAGELVDDVLPTADVVVVAGPPVMFLAGFGWVVMLMVCAPLTILLAIVAVGLAAIAGSAAVVLGPYLLVRELTSTLRG